DVCSSDLNNFSTTLELSKKIFSHDSIISSPPYLLFSRSYTSNSILFTSPFSRASFPQPTISCKCLYACSELANFNLILKCGPSSSAYLKKKCSVQFVRSNKKGISLERISSSLFFTPYNLKYTHPSSPNKNFLFSFCNVQSISSCLSFCLSASPLRLILNTHSLRYFSPDSLLIIAFSTAPFSTS